MFTAAASAQVNRSIGRGQYRRPKQDKNAKVDFVESTVQYYTKELTLDDFQAAAIRQIYENERDNINDLMENREMISDERNEKGFALTERIDAKVLKVLGPEQVEKFNKLKEARKK